ncbi:NADH-ubiquinone oxidoreductase [Pontibacillus halophilus JSM 076056 = DSM 19796]|uniref:NADH-ubiquinone oxidoreductase n=1 Tax=Pontibacillus halophilus JSM 076056 = DSM 19796 TaxID=1385510 RepID=A0A0A5GSC0_9BACI|nr:SDR family NAD(P)-dependent oxidoreductase [Pontibacillus halophilus]KGX94025.1 NADH-ubiquinone oxidoreductase [Pontibacillus halophilus JSM 076056 = DSM 19796]
MRVAVVGATGSIGTAIVRECVGRGIEVIAIARNQERLLQRFEEEHLVSLAAADAHRFQQLKQATRGADLIIHALNLPYYEWEEHLEAVTQNVIDCAKEHRAKFVMVENIYGYGLHAQPVSEEAEKRPNTKKGALRNRLEKQIWDAHQEGVDSLICHFPDFFGPHATPTMLHQTFSSTLRRPVGIFIGNMRAKREYIYTPDAAKALLEVTLRPSSYGETWNIPGPNTISGHEINQIIRRYYGRRKWLFPIRKEVIRMMGWGDPMMRELVEMMDLTRYPVKLDGTKYRERIGPLFHTPFEEAVTKTLDTLNETEKHYS